MSWGNVFANVVTNPGKAIMNASTRAAQARAQGKGQLGIAAAFYKPSSIFSTAKAAPIGTNDPNSYSYKIKTNPTGGYGVDYFQYGNPITNTQYFAGTNQDPALESKWITDYAKSQLPTGSTVTTDPGRAGTTATFNPTVLNGVTYTDINSYTNALNQAAQAEYDRNMKQIERSYQSGLIDLSQKEDLIKQNRETIKTQAANLLTTYKNNLNALGTTKTDTLNTQAGYFNSIAPDVQQSQQGDYANRVNTEYQNQVTNLDTQKAQNETAINQGLAQLDTQQGNLARAREDLGIQNQNNILGLNQSLQTRKDQLAQGKLDFANKVAAGPVGGIAPKTTTYSAADVLAGLKGQYDQFANVPGVTPEMKKAAISANLTQAGIDPKTADNYINYFYSNVVPQLGY